MKSSNIKAKIIDNKSVVDGIYKLKIQGQFQGKPGQFYMLRGWNGLDPFLARPISIYDIDNNYISFLYQDKGIGTNLLSKLKPGDTIILLGPLGNSFGNLEGKKIALVGGGIGVAPLFFLAKTYLKKFDFYAGFQDKVYEIDRMKEISKEIYISTDTGNYGYKGFITDIIDYKKYDLIVTCGPKVMMEKISREHKNTIISMEERMACGIGACMGCNIETKSGNKKVCKDGPIFLGKEVFF